MGTKASLSSQTAASLACLYAAGACMSFWCGWKQILCCPSRKEAWIHLLRIWRPFVWMCEARALCFRSSFGWRWPRGARWLNPSDAATRRAQSTWKAFEHRVGRLPHEDGRIFAGEVWPGGAAQRLQQLMVQDFDWQSRTRSRCYKSNPLVASCGICPKALTAPMPLLGRQKQESTSRPPCFQRWIYGLNLFHLGTQLGWC